MSTQDRLLILVAALLEAGDGKVRAPARVDASDIAALRRFGWGIEPAGDGMLSVTAPWLLRRRGRGRGRKPTKDWAAVDWSQPTVVIARALDCHKTTVIQARRKYAPNTIGSIRAQAKYDWAAVDWARTTSDIAAEMRLECSQVSYARRKHAPQTVRESMRGVACKCDWAAVDWGKRNCDIARALKVSQSAVGAARKRQNKP